MMSSLPSGRWLIAAALLGASARPAGADFFRADVPCGTDGRRGAEADRLQPARGRAALHRPDSAQMLEGSFDTVCLARAADGVRFIRKLGRR